MLLYHLDRLGPVFGDEFLLVDQVHDRHLVVDDRNQVVLVQEHYARQWTARQVEAVNVGEGLR